MALPQLKEEIAICGSWLRKKPDSCALYLLQLTGLVPKFLPISHMWNVALVFIRAGNLHAIVHFSPLPSRFHLITRRTFANLRWNSLFLCFAAASLLSPWVPQLSLQCHPTLSSFWLTIWVRTVHSKQFFIQTARKSILRRNLLSPLLDQRDTPPFFPLGFNDVPWNNPSVQAPTLSALAARGTVLVNQSPEILRHFT